MAFDQREWVNDVAVAALTGLFGGVVTWLFVTDAVLWIATASAGAIGLLGGMLNLPLRWLLNRRPPADGGKQ